jgi:hypothetical protein
MAFLVGYSAQCGGENESGGADIMALSGDTCQVILHTTVGYRKQLDAPLFLTKGVIGRKRVSVDADVIKSVDGRPNDVVGGDGFQLDDESSVKRA